MTKDQLLKKLEQAWAAFTASYAGLSEAQMVQPGVTQDWSVKDIVAHVSWWEEEALKHLPHILEGGRPPRYADLYGGIDAFNAQMTGLKRDLPLQEVLRQQAVTHARLLDYLRSAPGEQLAAETRFRRRLRLDTYSHYPEHTRAILAWREKQTTASG